jgi:RNA polymerase-interacting CarD/CdnL/TRCF family regulator
MANLNIGDKVIYGSQGIMTLVDCRQEPIGDEMKLYFVLSGVETATEALTFVPTDSERLTALIKPLLSREALGEQLSGFDKSTLPEWLESSRARQESFRKVLELGSRRDILGVVYLIRESGKRRLAEGKKNFISDENILKRAEKILSDEISLVFGITEEEAMKMINNAIE